MRVRPHHWELGGSELELGSAVNQPWVLGRPLAAWGSPFVLHSVGLPPFSPLHTAVRHVLPGPHSMCSENSGTVGSRLKRQKAELMMVSF